MQNSEALRHVGRLFTIVRLLSGRKETERVGRPFLAETCNCSVKTIQRDIDLLQGMGVPLRYDEAVRTYILSDKSWRLPPIQLTPTDLLSLALLSAWFGRAANLLPFAPEISTALRKATAGLTTSQRDIFSNAADVIASVGGTARDYSAAPVGEIIMAIVQQRTIEMRYESRSRAPGRPEQRQVDPYRLDLRENRYLELQAWCHRRQTVLTFAVDRISDLVTTDQMFTKRAWSNDDDVIAGGLRGGEPVPVDALFDSETAAFAREHQWTFHTSFRSQPDGSVRMRGTVLGVDGLTKELLRWGCHVQVLGGPELLKRMTEEVRALANIYVKSCDRVSAEPRLMSLAATHTSDLSAPE